ncbi:phage tail tube protein [Sphingomonas sp. G-3-2-10]|uniref:phage tail tube protein n=1 Tax=Sphingomonas sp. G-3-2-10 TaxID=2728838 RepID=UPI001F0D870C|nr:phage tail tube protein [Sphingomonas sp. G-3-2-10]
MALVSSSDIQHSLIAETTFGVTPTATVTRHLLPLAPDAPLLTASATQIASPTRMPNRSNNGSKQGMKMVDGSLEMRFQKAPFMDVLLQSALSGTFATNTLKAGITDSSFSVLSVLDGTSAAGSQDIMNFKGLMATGFSLSAKGNEGVMASFQVIGADFANLTTNNPLVATTATYNEFTAADAPSITVGAVTLDVAEFTLDWKVDRTRRPVIGSNAGLAFGVNGTTEVTLTIKAYRNGALSAITGSAQAVSLAVGGVGTGMSFSLPAAYGDVPTIEQSDGSAFTNIVFKGGYDATQGTNFVITKL